MTEKTITICGKEVRIIYCAATESGFEKIANKSASVFSPQLGKNDEGKLVVIGPPLATNGDYISLGMAGIIAAYGKDNLEPPLEYKDILYNASPEDISQLVITIVNLRSEWYHIPKIVEEQLKQEAEQKGKTQDVEESKNVQSPTSDTQSS